MTNAELQAWFEQLTKHILQAPISPFPYKEAKSTRTH